MKEKPTILTVLHQLTPKQLIEYFWDYYKWPVAILLFFLFMIASIVHSNVTEKECILEGAFINIISNKNELRELENNFLDTCHFDKAEIEIFFDDSLYLSSDPKSASYEALQILITKIASGSLDFVVGDVNLLNDLAYGEYFYDLSQILTPTQLHTLEPYLYYIDNSLINTTSTQESLISIKYPDPTKPELMKEPIPVFISPRTNTQLHELYLDSAPVLGIAINAPNVTNTLFFIDYLFH